MGRPAEGTGRQLVERGSSRWKAASTGARRPEHGEGEPRGDRPSRPAYPTGHGSAPNASSAPGPILGGGGRGVGQSPIARLVATVSGTPERAARAGADRLGRHRIRVGRSQRDLLDAPTAATKAMTAPTTPSQNVWAVARLNAPWMPSTMAGIGGLELRPG